MKTAAISSHSAMCFFTDSISLYSAINVFCTALVIGGFRQLQKDAEIGYSDETSDVIQNALEHFIGEHLPKLDKVKITHRWSGIMGFSVDGQPMVGAIPTDQQLYFIGGFTAHGLGLAFHCAKSLADVLFERDIPSFISANLTKVFNFLICSFK